MANIFRPSSWFRADDENDRARKAPDSETTGQEASQRSGAAHSVAGDTEAAADTAPAGAAVERAERTIAPDSLRSLIEKRAYFKWHSDGCPAGRDEEYWLLAETEVLSEIQSGRQRPSE